MVPLFSGFRSFVWEVSHNFYYCSLYAISLFKLWLFLRFIFHLLFLEVSLWCYLVWFYLFLSCLGFAEFLRSVVLIKFRRITYFLIYISLPDSLFSLWDSKNMFIRLFDPIAQVIQVLFILKYPFFFCVSGWMVFIDSSSNLLILFSVMVNHLWIPSNEYFISNIIFLNSNISLFLFS